MTLNLPHQFTAGTLALASELNSNFSTLKNGINSNTAKINQIEENITDKASKNGDITENFNVKDATEENHAVTKSQLDSVCVPVGTVIWTAMANAPDGYLICNGSAVSRTTYSKLYEKIGVRYGSGNGTTTFNLPDLRGVFIRGLDQGRNLDPSRTLGSYQADEFKSHNHSNGSFNRLLKADKTMTQDSGDSSDSSSEPNLSTSGVMSNQGGSETRPKNIALLGCIKY